MSDQPVYFVQHRDLVAGVASLNAMRPAGVSADALLVRSHFATVQGEGPFAGRYAYFVRLAGCNYGAKNNHCQFCDTDFAMDKSTWMTPDELRALWQAARCELVVITGGEPTLQGAALISLIEGGAFELFQIETNGTQPKVIQTLLQLGVTVVVSPKWSSSGSIISPSAAMFDHATFKFLISANPNEQEHALPDWIGLVRSPFYLSPIAVYKRAYEGEVVSAWDGDIIDREATRANYAEAAQRVMLLDRDHGMPARLSIQQHIFTAIP